VYWNGVCTSLKLLLALVEISVSFDDLGYQLGFALQQKQEGGKAIHQFALNDALVGQFPWKVLVQHEQVVAKI
jgi:hypothetical protein